MKTICWRSALYWLLLGSVSLLFLTAGIGKLCDLRGFIDDVEAYELMPAGLLVPFTTSLPWLEILVAVALWIPKWRLTASCLLAGLSSVFCLAVASAMIRGIEVSCGCFGGVFKDYLGGKGGMEFLARDLFLLSVCLALAWNCGKKESQFSEVKQV
ncbi:MAG: hypothetical protein PHV34_18445 [Verrucomicrobiae bacterium]|nr:hypothetical protein [Verrucomicrobiae bacterium]